MKRIILTSMLIIVSGLGTCADETYRKFLQLRTVALDAQGGYYQAETNGVLKSLGKWMGNGVCLVTPTDGAATNIIGVATNIGYYVTTQAGVTNVHSVVHWYQSGTTCHFRYSKERQVSMIEDCGPAIGDMRIYFLGHDGDLERYCTVTNFIASHGMRHYKKGEVVSEDKGLIDFSIFK